MDKDPIPFPAAYYRKGETRLVVDEADAAAAKKEGWSPHPDHANADKPKHAEPPVAKAGPHPDHPHAIADADDDKPSAKSGKK